MAVPLAVSRANSGAQSLAMTGPVRGPETDEIIMGAAIGLSLQQVTPFLKSLRNAGYAGPVALWVDSRLERELRGTPIAGGVITIRARQWLPFKLNLVGRPKAMRLLWTPLQRTLWAVLRLLRWLPLSEAFRKHLFLPIAFLYYTPMEARFLRFEEFVADSAHGRVLITDVRDVVFQRDPFVDLPRGGLAVSLETDDYTVASEPHNAMWIERVYGGGMLARIGHERVSCVGVTYGDRTAILDYLRRFNQELFALGPTETGIGGADTAIHNMLLRTDQLGEPHLLEPLHSPVATLNGISEAAARLSPEGRLLNMDGSEPSVLHQYDRLRGVSERLLRSLAS